ncbi:MAG: hypothetical protein ACLQVD_11625 [Capsulimonadaceae bacterium]
MANYNVNAACVARSGNLAILQHAGSVVREPVNHDINTSHDERPDATDQGMIDGRQGVLKQLSTYERLQYGAPHKLA